MLKTNKKGLILSSIAILAPMLVGLALWNRLPDQMTIHWGADGAADGWSHKAVFIFGLPLLLLAMQWLCVWFTGKDNEKREQSRKVTGVVLWIMPVLSWFVAAFGYAVALDYTLPMSAITLLPMGLLFVVIGNYLPKCRQNRTIGIKVKWTLEDEENWNATHRFAGRVWVVGGLLVMACVFLPEGALVWIMSLLLLPLAVLPMVYSYVFYRKRLKSGAAVRKPMPKNDRRTSVFVGIFFTVLAVGLAILLFTGDIRVQCGEEKFTVEASFDPGIIVPYAEIDAIEYRDKKNPGSRTFGFGSPRLSMGTFQNDEFGSYTRYAYTQCPAEVVLRSGEKTLVLSGKNPEETRALYERLAEKIE